MYTDCSEMSASGSELSEDDNDEGNSEDNDDGKEANHDGKRTLLMVVRNYLPQWRQQLIVSGLNYYPRAQIEELVVLIHAWVANGIQEAVRAAPQNSIALIPTEVLNKVQQWLSTRTSSLLWVEGPVFPSDLSPTALRVCSVLVNERIPCIPFFHLRRYHNPWKLDHGQAGVVCLLYTLIHELVYQLPSVIHSDIVLDESYFVALDGSWKSTARALDIIRAFLTHKSSGIVFVISGLEAVDDRATRPVLKDLVDIIRDHSSKTVVKTLFVTNGMSQTLGSKTTTGERVDASRLAQSRPGRPLRGGSSLNELQVHDQAQSKK